METSGSGTDEDPYQKVPVPVGRRRRPLKGGGAPGYKGSPPPSFMKGILNKIVGGLAHKLRAGMKSKLSFMVGVGKVISGLGAAVTSIFAGEEVHTELLLASLYLVMARSDPQADPPHRRDDSAPPKNGKRNVQELGCRREPQAAHRLGFLRREDATWRR